MPVFDLVGESYPLPSKPVSSQRTINFEVLPLTAVNGDPKAMVPKMLKCSHGVEIVKAIGNGIGICRGQFVSSTGPGEISRLYGVYGTEVIRWRTNMSDYDVLGVIGGTQKVSFADNGFDVLIVCNGVAYSAPLKAPDGAVTMTGLTLPVSPGTSTPIAPTVCAFIAQRFIVNTGFNNVWFYSNLASTTFELDSYYSAESSADPINGLASVDGSLWTLGPSSYEVWRIQDDVDSPFTSVGGNAGAIGCSAGSSIATVGNEIFWLGGAEVGSSGVYVGNGISATRISNPGIEYLISTLSYPTDVRGFSFADGGREFYALTFVAGDLTLVFSKTGGWTERATKDASSHVLHAWSVLYPVRYNDQLYTGCFYTRNLYRMSDTIPHDYDGRVIVRKRICPVIQSDLSEVILNQVVFDMDTGSTESLTVEPQLQLEISRDGGHTTVGPIRTKGLGMQGNYTRTVRFDGGGSGKHIVLTITYASNEAISNIFKARLEYGVSTF